MSSESTGAPRGWVSKWVMSKNWSTTTPKEAFINYVKDYSNTELRNTRFCLCQLGEAFNPNNPTQNHSIFVKL